MNRDLLRHIISIVIDTIPGLSPLIGLKTIDTFQNNMTNDVHALYSRAMSRRDFVNDMTRIITNQLTEAWNKGADEMLVLPEDMTDEDNATLQALIDSEIGYLDGLADAIQQAQSDRTGWEQFGNRVDIWVNRYQDVQNQAKLYFGGKDNLEWVYGDTDHCDTCEKLNGIVAWASEWEQAGFHPQQPPNDLLTCQGWQCQCELITTGKRRTRNALSLLMDLATARNT